MASNLEEPMFSNDIVKNEIMDSQEGQMRLAAGKDEKWPVKEEVDVTPVVKKEVEEEEMWRFGGCDTQRKTDFVENLEAKRRKLSPGVETNSYVTQKERNAEVKEESDSIPLPDNQVFNAHDYFTNEAMVKGEMEEFLSKEPVSGNQEKTGDDDMGQMADDNESEKEEDLWKVCPVDGCLEKSSSEKALQKHMRIHPKPMICGLCKRPWPNAFNLRAHYRRHSGDKPFQCDYCGRKFSDPSYLKVHIRQHTGELPFECDMCDRKFASSSSLSYHRRTHSQETMFACILCNYRTASSGDLSKHIRTHTGKKPFECADCGQCFSRKNDLDRHEDAVHLGIKMFSCTECDHKSAQKADLFKHIRAKHKK